MQFFKDTPWGGDDFSMSRIIDQLGQGLVGEMAQRRQRLNQKRALGAAFPQMTKEQIEGLSYGDPRTLAPIIKNELGRSSRQGLFNLAKKLGGEEPQGVETQGDVSQGGSPQQQMSSMQQGGILPQQGGPQRDVSQRDVSQRDVSQREGGIQLPETGELTEQGFRDVMSLNEQRKNRQLKRELSSDKALQANWKDASAENKELNESIAASEKFEKDLDDLIYLNKTGQLIQGKEHQALKALGLDKFFTNDVTQLAAKDIERMGAELLKQVRTGGRVTDFIFQSLKATIPSLINNKSGLDAIAKTVKIETVLDRKYKEMKRKVKGEYQRRGLPVPMLTIDEEVKARMKPYEDRMNKDRMKIVGNTIVNSIPTIKEEAAKLKSGAQKRFNGILLRKDGNDWFIVPEENLS